jgi:hypothetical protein
MLCANKLQAVSREPPVTLRRFFRRSIARSLLRVMKHFSAIVTEGFRRNLTFGWGLPLYIKDFVFKMWNDYWWSYIFLKKHIARGISRTTGHLEPIPSSFDSPGSTAGYEALFRDSCPGGPEKFHFWWSAAPLHFFKMSTKMWND